MKRFLAIFVLLAAATASADEYRAYWVDTFRTPFATATDVTRIVDAAVDSNANALFVQVRRRGDAWYLDAAEPLAETLDGTFDPLRALLDAAHARGIQVHAFVIVGAVYRGDPAVDPLPRDPHHVFLQHVWDARTHKLIRGPRQWATRTSKGRLRFESDYYLDLGHPDAAAYTAEVLLHLVRAYDIDGLHLDRVRYPESPRGDVGYNETSVARFRARYGRAPRAKDPLWNDWRREQVTNFVRRVSLGAKAIRPSITISAALISWGTGPRANGGFRNTDAYRIAFQDWESWLREGIIDAGSPMLYKREHVAAEKKQFDDWLQFLVTTAHANGRAALPGIGAYLNSIEGTLRQARRARAANADGIIFFAMGDTKPWSILANSTNDAVRHNPYALPVAGVFTPKRPNEEFFLALRKNKGTDGHTAFERTESESPLFAMTLPAPRRAEDPNGAVMGYASGDGTVVTIQSLVTRETRTTRSDGSGFFGMLALPPGEYRVAAGVASSTVNVDAGKVSIWSEYNPAR
ncbi:MAG: hypothetical protein QOK37_3194 [Thermoanaerobaculia bacterium]|jgi:uncharacterized lipoprotein YddW (UPF0748 family)|nr:hypothetical protein [Thermoanaerobaculia bacterium]